MIHYINISEIIGSSPVSTKWYQTGLSFSCPPGRRVWQGCRSTSSSPPGRWTFGLVCLTTSETQPGCSIATSDTYFTIFALSHHVNEHHMSKFGNHNIQEPLSWIQRLVQQLVPRWRQITEFLNGQGWTIESKTTELMTNQQSWSFVCFDVMLTVCIAFCFETSSLSVCLSWALGSCSRYVAS